MDHVTSDLDREFQSEFEACSYPVAQFGHVEHVRLAYTYLVDLPPTFAIQKMRSSLLTFLASLGIEGGKYHETLTAGWIYAVRHFMELSPPCTSSTEFVDRNRRIRDSRLLLAHYSEEVLFSDEARAEYVEPDLLQFPDHAV
jgi:hypothetical protein